MIAAERVLVLRARARQRGAAVLMVVLVITLLMGIGMFAARSAVLSTTASGFERQMTQTHYVTQYGMLASTAELSVNAGSYVQLMATKPDPQCAQGILNSFVSNFTCYRFGYSDMQAIMQNGNTAKTFIAPTDVVNQVPGSLGVADLEADWLVEMTDLGPANLVAGNDLTSAGAANLRYMSVTLTATGQVRPRSTGATANQTSATTASLETTRAHLIVGPLPKL